MKMNRQSDYFLADSKIESKRWLRRHGLPTPELIEVIETSAAIRPFLNGIEKPNGFVIKPNMGAMGNGVKVVAESFGQREPVSRLRSELHWLLCRILAGEFSGAHAAEIALAEERVVCGAQLASISGFGSADIRVVCCGGEPVMSMMRLPTRTSQGKANLHQGGVGVGVDIGSGKTTHGIHGGRGITHHPDTGAEMAGINVPSWESDIIPVAKSIAAKCPLKYCGIDVMIDESKGPLVVELNARPGLGIQVANRMPLMRAIKRALPFAAVAAACLFAPFSVAAAGSSSGRISTGNAVTDTLLPAEEAIAERELGLAEARDLAKKNPSDATILNDLAVALHREGLEAESVKCLMKAIRLDPEYHRAAYNLGTSFLTSKRYEEAEAALNRAVELQPFYAEALYNLGLVHMYQDQPAKAIEQFKAVVEISRDARFFKAYYNMGLCHASTENYREALRAYRNALNLNLGHAPSHINMGICLAKLGLALEAKASYGRALSLDEGNWRARFNLAITLLRVDLPNEALEALSAIPPENRQAPDVLNLTGNVLMRLERPDAAAKLYAAAFAARANPEFLYNLARAQSVSQRKEEAIATYERVLDLQPDYFEAAYNLCVLFKEAGLPTKALERLEALVAGSPENSRLHFTLGNLYEELGRAEEAVALLTKAVKLAPEEPEYHFALGLAEFRGGNPRAAASYRKAAELAPNRPKYPYNLGLALMAEGKHEEAVQAFSRAEQLDADYFEAVYNRGMALLKADKPQRALEVFNRARSMNPGSHQVYNNIGLAYTALGDSRSAATAYSKAIQLDSSDATAYFNLALLYRKAGRRQDEERLYRDALEKGAASPALLNNLGMLEAKEGDPEKAEALYRKALSIDPGYAHAGINLAALLSRLGRSRDASAALAPFFDKGTASPEMFFNDGMARMRAGDDEAACRRFEAAIEGKPDYREALHNLGLIYLRKGDAAKAKEILAPLLGTETSTPETLYNLALAQMRTGDFEDAERTLKTILESFPDYPEAQYNLGCLYLRAGKHVLAVERFEQAVEIRKGYYEAWHNLGLAYAELGEVKQAVSAYTNAIEAGQTNAAPYFNLALLYRKSGDLPRAGKVYRNALESGAASPALLTNLARMESDEGMVANAERLYRRALGLDRWYGKAALNLAALLSRENRPAEASAILQPFFAAGKATPAMYYNDGMAALRAGDDAAAIRRFTEALVRDPDYTEARHNLGLIHLRNGDFQRAEEALEPLSEGESAAPRALYNLALAQMRGKQLDAAEQTLRTIIDISPEYAEAHYNLGVVLLEMAKPDAARGQFRAAASIRNDYPEAWYNLALCDLRARKHEAALTSLRTALKHRDDYPEAWYNVGVILSRSRDPEMTSAFQKAVVLMPDNVQYLSALGRSYQKLKKYDMAADAYSRVTVLSPEADQRILSRHVYCLGKAGRHDDAATAYEELTHRYPDNLTYKFNYAVLKSRMNDDEGAGELYREILASDPAYHKAWNNLAYTHIRANRFDEARKCLDEIRKTNPGYANLSASFRDIDAAEKSTGKP